VPNALCFDSIGHICFFSCANYDISSSTVLLMLTRPFFVIAVAFSPARNMRATSSLQMSDKKMVGASVEIGGNEIYDPLDMLKLHDVAPTAFPHAQWLREAELKHCRAAMLASVGAFTAQWGLAIPGYTLVEGGDPVENLNHYVQDYPLGFVQIILLIAVIEGANFPGDAWFGKMEREPGNIGYDPLGMSKGTDAQKEQMALKELKNGRLAMMAMAAYTAEHWIPGSVPFIPGKF
jgi:hypothetical protein